MNEITVNNANGVLTVSSLQVAKDFGKRPSDVHEAIENLTAENSAVKNFFIESSYINERGRKYRCYDIARDGFSLLVMGFTRKKDLEWKLRYIEAFNSMERQLININYDIEKIFSRVLDEKIDSVIHNVRKTVEKTSYETIKHINTVFRLYA
ncbi:MAG: Rha family transcriptional regulator [Ruminococcus sp.]|nr:Rha family transcriptional regulator [Ruminococcus sp.]MDE6848257.1 Rha family transcriptional regulator [Ruminococcus sp.]